METIDGYTSAEYGEHIAPVRAAVLAALGADQGDDLRLAGRARELGASWTELGESAGITGAEARERWRAAPREVFTRRHGHELAALARLVQ